MLIAGIRGEMEPHLQRDDREVEELLSKNPDLMIVSLVCNERCISTVCHVDDGIDRRKKLPKRLVSQVEKKRNMIRAKSRNLNPGLEFLVLCDSLTRVWSEILVDRVKHYVVYDESRGPRAFCARQFLDSFEGDSELQNFLTSLSETAMFAEVVRAEAKANSVRGKAPSHLP